MIKLKPEKSRMAVFAYSFAIFSPSLNISSQKKDINSAIGINSEKVNLSGAEKGFQSPSKKITGFTRATSIGIISTTETNSSSIVIYKSSEVYSHTVQFNGVSYNGNPINNNRIENIAGITIDPHDILTAYKSNALCAAASISRGFHRLKSIFIKNDH